jgi:hypothetical protein
MSAGASAGASAGSKSISGGASVAIGAAAGEQADSNKSSVARMLRANRAVFFIICLPPGSKDPQSEQMIFRLVEVPDGVADAI